MFKPRPEVYGLVTQRFKCKPGDVTFVSSNRRDEMASDSVGFHAQLIKRAKNPDEYPDFPPERVLSDLTALADAA
jgi:2-haloacid dehalogenase